MPRDEIEALQFHKLKKLLTIAQQHCPWHAKNISDAGIELNSDSPLSIFDLQLLPTMDKTDAQQNQQQIVWMEVPGGAYKYNTGGSSGQTVAPGESGEAVLTGLCSDAQPFIQHSLDYVEVIYVPNSKWDNEASIQIKKELKKRLGDVLQVKMTPLEKIPAEASGKHRYVISHVPLPNNQGQP